MSSKWKNSVRPTTILLVIGANKLNRADSLTTRSGIGVSMPHRIGAYSNTVVAENDVDDQSEKPQTLSVHNGTMQQAQHTGIYCPYFVHTSFSQWTCAGQKLCWMAHGRPSRHHRYPLTFTNALEIVSRCFASRRCKGWRTPSAQCLRGR